MVPTTNKLERLLAFLSFNSPSILYMGATLFQRPPNLEYENKYNYQMLFVASR